MRNLRKRTGFLLLLLLSLLILTAGAETQLMLSSASARVGEVVEISVRAGEDAAFAAYTLERNGTTVFRGADTSSFTAAFRPREEGTYTLRVQVKDINGGTEEASARLEVAGEAEAEQGPAVIYSQKDGWWESSGYARSNLEKAGCAIFTLSHALQRMGWSGEDVLPAALAVTYAGCYTEGGTANGRLITRASEVYAYTTAEDLMENKTAIRDALKQGDYFSFSIVTGHIALICGIDETGQKVRIVDSAPGATFERIKSGRIYCLEDGEYREAKDPSELPGARYFFETDTWGGMTYYMDLDYVARRGVRLIRPAWLSLTTEEGSKRVKLETMGTALCKIRLRGEAQEVETRTLRWNPSEEGENRLAVVNGKSSVKLVSSSGSRLAAVPACAVLPVLEETAKQVYVIWQAHRGYLSKGQVTLCAPAQEIRTGLISVNGYTNGRAKVNVRWAPSAKAKIIAEWPTGTRVAVLEALDGFLQVEANGLRVWVQEEYVTPQGTWEDTDDGQKIDEGE